MRLPKRAGSPCIVLLVVLACAPRSSDQAAPQRDSAQYVTAAEIRGSGASTAWEALKFTVRTHRFSDYQGIPVSIQSSRGQGSLTLREEPQVFLDGVRLTDITLLRMIPAGNLFSIEVLTGPDATTRYGTSAVAGVILLETTLGGPEGEEGAVPHDTGQGGRP